MTILSRSRGLDSLIPTHDNHHRRQTHQGWEFRVVRGTSRNPHLLLNRRPESVDEQAARVKCNEHLDYLKRMDSSGVVTNSLAFKAKIVWLVARVTIGARLPIPAAATFSGGPIEYHWDVGPHQLSVEIPEDGPCHWSYRNKITGETWGTETRVDEGFPPRLVKYLSRIVACNR